MSAAEKLRALKPEGLVETVAPFEGYTDAVCLSIPAHAAVVAVVELAERIAQTDAPVWGTRDGLGFKLQDALAALDEALT